MKSYRVVLLIGLLVALIFFYLGLNEWINSSKVSANPPPIVYKERTEKEVRKDIAQKVEVKKDKGEEKTKEKKQEKIRKEQVRKDVNKVEAKRKEIQRATQKKEAKKQTYRIVQIGAFSKEKNAKVAMKKASGMGFKVNIVKEDGFYKVRVFVDSRNFKSDFRKLKRAFGGAIIIK